MRIAQLAPIWIRVPPEGYGGIEWIAALLADGFAERGHNVTLFASGDSVTKAKLAASFPVGQRHRMGEAYPDVVHALSCYLRQEDFDIIHDHSGIIGPAIGAVSDTPVLHTLHGPFVEDARNFYRMIGDRIWFNAISDNQRSGCPDLNYIGTIYNAIRVEDFPFRTEKKDHLMFLGRMSELKGAAHAVQTALRLGMKLQLVGKIDNDEEERYFSKHVEPHLDGQITFMGEVGPDEKAQLLSEARAVLFPIQWAEPFGLVMIEAMATGTPVIAWRNGSVPEVIRHGETGFIVDSVEEAVEAVKRVDEIDPQVCRQDVVERFSVQRMVADYERAYKAILKAPKLRRGSEKSLASV